MHALIPGEGHTGREIFISTVHFEDEFRSGVRTVLDVAPLAAKLGVQGVEYRDVYWKDKARELPAVRDQVAKLKLKATYTSVTPLYNREPAIRQQLLQDIIAALDATGKHVPFCFEFPGEGDPEGAIRKSLEFMTKLGG